MPHTGTLWVVSMHAETKRPLQPPESAPASERTDDDKPMKARLSHRRSSALIVSVLAVIAAHSASAAAAGSGQSVSTRIRPYLMPSEQQEIALARSAAPPAISMHATVMVLTARGYVTKVKGSNGFVCVVTRSWDSAGKPNQPNFWDPRISVPKCYNPAAARTLLTENLLMKTRWVVAGASQAEIVTRVKAAWAAGKIEEDPAGAMSYMMSKRSWGVGGSPGAWRPHLMFYFPVGKVPDLGANLGGVPVVSGAEDDHTVTVNVLVPIWSDGSPAPSLK
jgi:hypothetical protein